MQVKQKSNGVGMAHSICLHQQQQSNTFQTNTSSAKSPRYAHTARHTLHAGLYVKIIPVLNMYVLCTYPLETVLEVWWIDLIETLIHNYLLRQMKNNNSIAQINLSTQNYDIFFNVFQSQKYYNIVCSFGWWWTLINCLSNGRTQNKTWKSSLLILSRS